MRRVGGQRPTFERVTPYHHSDGQQIVDLFEMYGRRYYESQKYEMMLFAARTADGKFAARSIGLNKPRQNGKSFAARDYLTNCAVVEGMRCLFSAHHGKTVRAMFKEIKSFIEENEDFQDELVDVVNQRGEEGLYFASGGCIEFQTRTNSGGRGGTYHVIIIDEAQELTRAQQSALLPTISAATELDDDTALGTQVIYIGTPCCASTAGDVFQRMHDRAHSGSGSAWWLEWAAQGDSLDDVDVENVDLWYATNPAMGRRISEDTIRSELGDMDKLDFAVERLSWWPTQKLDTALDLAKWNNLATAEPPKGGFPVFGVKFSVDGSIGVVSVCNRVDGYPEHVELVEVRGMGDGLQWFVDTLERVAPKSAQIVIDGASNAQPLVDKLLERGVGAKVLVKPKTADVVTACALLADSIKDGSITHYDQSEVNQAIREVTKRSIGTNGGYGFAGDGCEIAESIALALWGARNTKRNPNRKVKVA